MHEPHVAFTEILGQVIRKHRQAIETTQDKFAPQIAVSASALSRIESGQTPLTVIQLRRIGETLGVPASHLLYEAEQLATNIPKASPGVRVVAERPKANTPDAAGWFLGGAAIGALVASMLSGSEGEDNEAVDRPKARRRRK